MKTSSFLLALFFYLMAPAIANAQLTLTVEVYDLRNNTGIVHLELSNEQEKQVAAFSKRITDKNCIFVIEGLEPGKYSVRFIHDENENNEIDTNWLGIPKEGFGFSNNPRMTFGPPKFKKTLFDLSESTTLRVKPKYY
jgi:uncharacterized protein (DUF2141 family)